MITPTQKRAPVIQAVDVDIGYPGRVVGKALSLALYPGEVLCLLGPNGSGKSTLFRSLLGLLPVRSGQVALNGRPVSEWLRRDVARQVAYVPQAQEGAFAFRVLDMVLMGRTAHLSQFAGPSQNDQALAMQCLQHVGIAELAQRRYTEISGGERQLALIARALAQQPQAMVMDEPTAALDFGNQVRVLEYIRTLRQKRLGILLCTHQPDHALRVADRILLLKNGQLQPLDCTSVDHVIDQFAWLYDLGRDVVAASIPPVLPLLGSSH